MIIQSDVQIALNKLENSGTLYRGLSLKAREEVINAIKEFIRHNGLIKSIWHDDTELKEEYYGIRDFHNNEMYQRMISRWLCLRAKSVDGIEYEYDNITKSWFEV